MSSVLYVDSLPPDFNKRKLREYFETKGYRSIESVEVQRRGGQAVGIVTFKNDQTAGNLQTVLKGARVGQNTLNLSLEPPAAGGAAHPGPPAHANPAPAAHPNPAAGAADNGQRFVHAYNFVPIPADGLGNAAGVKPFARTTAAPHDRLDPERYSGSIECDLVTDTQWFIPDLRKRKKHDRDHWELGYFTLDPVDESAWDPQADRTTPAVPASSIRGMVRSVFETATLSCLSVFDWGALDLRVGYDPGLVPVRVVTRSGRTIKVRLLDGRMPREASMLRAGLLQAYNPKVIHTPNVNGRPQRTPGAASGLLGNLIDGTAVAAVIDWAPIAHRAYQYRRVQQVVALASIDPAAPPAVAARQRLVFGYLHRTGPNFDRKHDERVFFDATAPYNSPAPGLTLAERLSAFKADEDVAARPATVKEVDPKVVDATDASLSGYADRHKRTLQKQPTAPRDISRMTRPSAFLSDFVGQMKRIQKGMLLYALLDSTGDVRGLYPVAIPRLNHEDTRAELLHKHFHPCSDHESLCCGCRVFGWAATREGRQREPARVDSYAGHVRFTHGVLKGNWGDLPDHTKMIQGLAILGSPKPTTTPFYLSPRAGFAEAVTSRWPPVLNGAVPAEFPLYRRAEASLRGRKFYRRRTHAEWTTPQPSDQNQTVHLLPKDLTFRFRVFFDNLTKAELGALLFALTLQPPKGWMPEGLPLDVLRHALGHGKPLGLGGGHIVVQSLDVDGGSVGAPAARYARVPSLSRHAVRADQVEVATAGAAAGAVPHLAIDAIAPQPCPGVDRFIAEFGTQWAEAEKAEVEKAEAEKVRGELRRVREDLIEMLRSDEMKASIQYPNFLNAQDRNFMWFTALKGAKGPLLPGPTEERNNPARRLPYNP